MAKVTSVNPQGVMYGRIKAGDEVIAFNDRPFEDILDYIYADSDDCCKITIIDKNKNKKDIKARKDFDGDTLGLEFDNTVEITPKECNNNCVFCFVNQLPKGLRDTLYVKDDDYRFSFVSGSYITCTNLSERDIQRIIEYKLSPLYISVHSTDEDIRKFMLGIKKAQNQMDIIKRLTASGIDIHTQIVLVPDVNDNQRLEKSLNDLWEAKVKSVAVVPVGLTCHRQGLYDIKPLTKQDALKAIEITEKFYNKHKFFCYVSDEMYQRAELSVKDYDYYGNFEQIENGVGLIAKFLYEIEDALEYAPKKLNKTVGIITGVSGENVLMKAKEILQNKWKKLKINIYPIKNTFFGNTVTVSGLVTATDIAKQLKGITDDEELIIPSVMLKEFDTVFLDGNSLEWLQQKLNKKILVSAVTGECFVDTIVYGE